MTMRARHAPRHAVFVHGMWSQPWVWQDWVACFEQAGYVCNAVTLPGHEAGARPGAADGLGIGEYVAAVEKVLRELPEPAVLVGHSMGGMIAQQLAARVPVATVVLINSAAPAPVFPLRPVMLPGVIRHFLRPNLYSRSFLPSRWEAGHLFLNGLPESQRDAMRARLIPESGRALYQLGFGALNFARSNRVERDDITAPMLALSGVRDHIIPIGVSRAMARWYGPQRLEFREYREHAHWMLAEPGWERRVDEVLQWLADREKDGGP
jgi:pimeloyl-ACP methyl ester carboxylesterase